MTTGRRLRAALLLTVTITAVAACARDERPADDGAGARPPGAHTYRIDTDEGPREYRLYRPADLDRSPTLVVMLHGGGGSARQAERAYGWDDVADREGVLVAYPDGVGRTWNAGGGCCGQAARDDVDDVGFLLALIDELVTADDVDPARTYVTGMSNGAMLSYALACSTGVVAAIAPVAGTMLADCPSPGPVSVLHIHGSADDNVRFDGGLGAGAGRIDGPPVPSVIEQWRAVDGCTPPTVTTVGAVQNSVSYCAEGREVQLTTVEGAGHQWPGSDVVRDSADPPSAQLDATETIWRFFEANPRP